MFPTRSLGLAMLVVAIVAAGSPARATGAAPECRVRNVTQDTVGRSLASMIEQARDGDHFTVRGTCAGTVVVRDDVTIAGVGVKPTLTGSGKVRVVRVAAAANATIRGLRIMNGVRRRWPARGAGILNRGRLSLKESIIRGNRGIDGGGIFNRGQLTLTDSLVAGNMADPEEFGFGGGISNGGSLEVIRSTIAGNLAYGGGGISSWRRLTLTDVTIARNESVGSGAGLATGGGGTMADSSITDNRSYRGSGGGISVFRAFSVVRSRIADNVAFRGGGISNRGSLTLAESRVSRNVSEQRGGGINNVGSATLKDSEVSGNRVERGGGGIRNTGTLVLESTAVRQNVAATRGGGIHNRTGSAVTVDGASDVSENTPDDCFGTSAC